MLCPNDPMKFKSLTVTKMLNEKKTVEKFLMIKKNNIFCRENLYAITSSNSCSLKLFFFRINFVSLTNKFVLKLILFQIRIFKT